VNVSVAIEVALPDDRLALEDVKDKVLLPVLVAVSPELDVDVTVVSDLLDDRDTVTALVSHPDWVVRYESVVVTVFVMVWVLC
jgi:hypothetical protein